MKNYFNYFTEIEEYFVQKRGKNLLVSPLDWSLIELWKDSGVPLHVALRGIDRSFESAARRQKSPPRTLFYCHPAVMEAFKDYSEAALGQSPREAEDCGVDVDPSQILQVLETLLESLERHERDPVRQRAEWVRELLEETRRKSRLKAAEVDRDLRLLASRIATALEADLSVDDRRDLDRRVAEALRPYQKRLSTDMIGQLEQSHRERLIREHFGLPEMSLL